MPPLTLLSTIWTVAGRTAIPPTMLNNGNTCFFNVCLGLLARQLTFVVQFPQHHRKKACGKQSCFACACSKTLTILSRNTSRKPHNVKRVLSLLMQSADHAGERLIPGQQQDAHEVLAWILDAMYGSAPCPTIGVELTSVYTCMTCGTPTVNEAVCPMLHLHIGNEKRSTIAQLLSRNYSQEEILQDRRCHGSCKGQVCKSSRLVTLKASKQHLIIVIERFSSDEFNGNFKAQKNVAHVSFDDILNLPLTGNQNVRYELNCVVEHVSRSVDSGHYIRYECRGRTWYYVSDEIRRVVPFSSVRNAQAYLLSYSRQEMKPSQGASSSRSKPRLTTPKRRSADNSSSSKSIGGDARENHSCSGA